MKSYNNGLFIFRRDLRVNDNIGLNEAMKQCRNLYTTFYFTPEQVIQNPYKSENAIQFMIESLIELQSKISSMDGELIVLLEEHLKVIDMLCSQLSIDAVFFNQDYSPYSKERDNIIQKYCDSKDIACNMYQDYYLYQPGTVLTTTGSAFQKYTPFYNHVLHLSVLKPNTFSRNILQKPKRTLKYKYLLNDAWRTLISMENKNILVNGGRKNGLMQLKKAIKEQCKYSEKRDELSFNTSFLSAFIKFGCVSIREVYHSIKAKFGINHGIIRELIWREFFAHVLHSFPKVLRGPYRYKSIKWRTSSNDFKKWCDGNTGFPVVDAGMRQMNATGYMHNRCRMVTATFLIKILMLNWRLGERYFAQKLTDYDPASNNGNWQGISGTGVDMKPYFRTMNPWIQSKKFDPDCEYIKQWIPELKDVPAKDIHTWHESWQKHKGTYIKPIADYKSRTEEMIKMYKTAGP